jgi:hypothetical protein
MIIAYKSCQPDNGTHMWANKKIRGIPPTGVICPACDQRIDYYAVNPNYKPPRSYNDLCRCYDGDFLVSPPLREFLESLNLAGVYFQDIPKSRRYFVSKCTNILQLIPPPTLQLEDYCKHCRQYKSVWGIKTIDDPVKLWFKDVVCPIREGIYLTDLRAGYGPLFGPLLLFGVETWGKIKAQKFKGTYGKAIHN